MRAESVVEGTVGGAGNLIISRIESTIRRKLRLKRTRPPTGTHAGLPALLNNRE